MDLKNFISKRIALEQRRKLLLDELRDVEQALGIGIPPSRIKHSPHGVIRKVRDFCIGKAEINTREIRAYISDGHSRHNVGPVLHRLHKMGFLVRIGHGKYRVDERKWVD